jgi:transcription initiation factor TFIID subunit TAF12
MAQALAVAATAVSTVGTLVGGEAQAQQARYEGKAQQQVANFHAAQLRQQAGQQRAVSQQEAIEQQRRARLARSRALAIASASGAGTDGSVQDILARLAAEGDINAQAAIYEGEEAARGLETQAGATQAEGKYANAASRYAARNIKRASYLSAAGTLMQGGSSFYSKYWPTDDATATAGETYGFGELSGGPGRTRRNYG